MMIAYKTLACLTPDLIRQFLACLGLVSGKYSMHRKRSRKNKTKLHENSSSTLPFSTVN